VTLKKVYVYGERNALFLMVPIGFSAYPGVHVDPINVRDGMNTGASVANQHGLGEFTFNENLGLVHQFASGDNYKSNLISAGVGASRIIVWQVNASLNASYGYTFYPTGDSNRKDSKFNFGINMSRSIGFLDSTIASLGYAHEKNTSNVASAKYDKDI